MIWQQGTSCEATHITDPLNEQIKSPWKITAAVELWPPADPFDEQAMSRGRVDAGGVPVVSFSEVAGVERVVA